MNVYDFDDTIYKGDSTKDFYLFCLKKHPKILFILPKQLFFFGIYILGIIDKKRFKEVFYEFLKKLVNVDKYLEEFWTANKHKIKKWYLEIKQPTDIIISASPYFLLEPICKKLEIKNLIASNVDKRTGKYIGENCYGIEKVIRYKELFKDQKIKNFYSDSYSDAPLMELAENSYIVDDDKLIVWNKYKPSMTKKMKTMFFSKEFLLFIFVGVINTFNGIFFSFLYSTIIDANLSFILGYITSLTISYFLNSFLTFKEEIEFRKYIKFCISYIPNFIIQNIIVLVVYNLLLFPKLVAYTLAALIGLPITFIALKLFAFNKKRL